MKTGEIMTRPAIVVREGTPLDEVATAMLARRIGSVLVVDDSGHIVGIVTRRDFGAKERGCPFPDFCAPKLGQRSEGSVASRVRARTKTAREAMTPGPITVAEDTSVKEVIAKMLHLGFTRLPVVRDGVPAGIVARHDLLRLMLLGRARPGHAKRPLQGVRGGRRPPLE